jgi:hypothetical protein
LFSFFNVFFLQCLCSSVSPLFIGLYLQCFFENFF